MKYDYTGIEKKWQDRWEETGDTIIETKSTSFGAFIIGWHTNKHYQPRFAFAQL